MTRSWRSAAALAAAVAAAPAFAADVGPAPYVTAPYGLYNWSGFHLGLNLAYQWGTVANSPFNPSGFAAGVQGGYDWQSGNLVFGLEADLQLSSADDMFAAYKFSNPWFGTIRGRGGLAFTNVLIYLTAGLAYGGGRVDLGGLSESRDHFGWTAGGGIEVGLTPHWSAKAEYLFVELSDQGYGLTGTPLGIESSLMRLGVNYRF